MSPDGTSLLPRPIAGTTVDAARAATDAAAAVAGVRIETPHELVDLLAATEIWRRIWTPTGEPLVSAEMLRALTHAGNYLSVARRGDDIAGALLGFFGGNGRVDRLHSHILGVDPAAQAHGVGFALKLHQRAWALERGIARITWTFDPLVRRNGHFNLAKLGARGVDYLVSFYGAMPDAVNGGDDSDRVLMEWDLAATAVSPHAGAQADDIDMWLQRGAAVALDTTSTGDPVLRDASSAGVVLCATPADIVALRRDDPTRARQWRSRMRAVMLDATSRGMALAGMAPGGWYVLTRTAS